jgi:hypothetical protein
VVALAEATKNERFAWDCYRRFIQMYGDVVIGVQKRANEDHEPFETVIHEFKHEKYHKDIVDSELTAEDQARNSSSASRRSSRNAPARIFPRSVGPAARRRRRRVRFLDERPRHRLSPQI